MPQQTNDAAFERLTECVNRLCRIACHVANGGGGDNAAKSHIYPSSHAVRDALATYKEARGQERYPAGTVVFLPDLNGEYGKLGRGVAWVGDSSLYDPRYRRIDITPPPVPKVEKTLREQINVTDNHNDACFRDGGVCGDVKRHTDRAIIQGINDLADLVQSRLDSIERRLAGEGQV